MYYVYLLASRRNGTLYVGATGDLVRRVWEHKNKALPGFTATYDVDRLVWFECHEEPGGAMAREKQLKRFRRAWKIAPIEENNPDWQDLYESICQ